MQLNWSNWARKKKLLAVTLGGLVALALIVWLGFVRGDDRLFNRAIIELTQTETLQARASLEFNLPPRLGNTNRPFTKINFEVDGGVALTEAGQPELGGNLFTEAKGLGNTFFAQGELRLLHDFTVFRLAELPVLLNPTGSLINRWTSTRTTLLSTEPIVTQQSLANSLQLIFDRAKEDGQETIADTNTKRFKVNLTAEDHESLGQLLSREKSKSAALDLVSRLLASNRVKEFYLWLEPKSAELTQLEILFARPLANETEVDFALLTVNLKDYGTAVTIDRPEAELKVQPEVFAKIFGTGQPVTVEEAIEPEDEQ